MYNKIMIDQIVKNSGLWLINNIIIEIVQKFNTYNILGKIVIFPIILGYYLLQIFFTVIGMITITICDLIGLFDVTGYIYKILNYVYTKLFKR